MRVKNIAIHNGTYCAEKGFNDAEVTITKKELDECKLSEQPGAITHFDEIKGVNKPQLATGMTPIKWDSNLNEIETTIDDTEWYNYADKKWANAKTADGSYWVWIPRYAYKITSCFHSYCSGGAGNIEIKFLKGTTNEAADGTIVETSGYNFGVKDTSTHYFLHPAFTFGEEEIPGFWLAKSEPSGSSSNINIVPNATSLRDMKIGNNLMLRLTCEITVNMVE